MKKLKGCAGYTGVKLGKQIEVKLSTENAEKQKSNSSEISEGEKHAKWPD